jgi:hypothetical protein
MLAKEIVSREKKELLEKLARFARNTGPRKAATPPEKISKSIKLRKIKSVILMR